MTPSPSIDLLISSPVLIVLALTVYILPITLQHMRALLRSFALLLMVGAVAAACGPFIEVISLDEAARARYRDEIRYYERQPDGSTLIQPIRATSCKQKIWDPGASQEDAIDQLRAKAAQLGGNGITNLACDDPEGMSLSKNCWSAFTCRANVIRVAP